MSPNYYRYLEILQVSSWESGLIMKYKKLAEGPGVARKQKKCCEKNVDFLSL